MRIKATSTFTFGTLAFAKDEEREVSEVQGSQLIRHGRAVAVGGSDGAAAPDYERDSLKDLALDKASKDQLLVIAAYEQADVKPDATKAQLVSAIETKRSAG